MKVFYDAPYKGYGLHMAMKLTALLMIITCLQVSANPISQRIGISVHKVSLDKLFSEIEKKTSYVFFYDVAALKNTLPITVYMKDASVEDIMQTSLKGQPLEYSIYDRTIFVKKDIQKAEVQGIVFSENGSPLAGATVFIKKLNKLTVTNEKGDFILNNIPDGVYTVEVSYIGFDKNVTTITVVDHQAKMEITMKPAANNLDETVVIPYGTTTQRLNTGNIDKVKADEIERQPITNRFTALEAHMRERLVTLIIRIRGKGFIVINFTRHRRNPLNLFDIKSIRIIKDADVITPYGMMTL